METHRVSSIIFLASPLFPSPTHCQPFPKTSNRQTVRIAATELADSKVVCTCFHFPHFSNGAPPLGVSRMYKDAIRLFLSSFSTPNDIDPRRGSSDRKLCSKKVAWSSDYDATGRIQIQFCKVFIGIPLWNDFVWSGNPICNFLSKKKRSR